MTWSASPPPPPDSVCWRQLLGFNIARPRSGDDDCCTVRYEHLSDAKAACLQDGLCTGITDTGLSCDGTVKQYELRTGIQVRATTTNGSSQVGILSHAPSVRYLVQLEATDVQPIVHSFLRSLACGYSMWRRNAHASAYLANCR